MTVVHVVDDDPAIRDSLSFLLSAADMTPIVYESALELLAKRELEPGCVVTDVRMPGMSGLELVLKLKERRILHPVIVLTGHGDVALAVEAMKAGVVDFIEKPFDEDVLLKAVRAALARDEDVTARQTERAEVEARIAQLSQREREVFEAIVAGNSNKAAALKLGISPRTVEIYRAHVMDKMGARTLSELVRMALIREHL
ncbi:two-component nitrogen fixation transcriptional regulator FixJ [alpha proteobacterium U9-1i]|nr:two-component nitrogen fixation transcriptional regulator FixJ [alpha proteobacterium U9-1i]